VKSDVKIILLDYNITKYTQKKSRK